MRPLKLVMTAFGLADPNVWMPLGFAAITAFGTAKLSRKEKKERRKKL